MAIGDGGEAGLLGDEIVVSGRDLQKTVFTIDVGQDLAGGAVLEALDGHRSFGDDRAGGIGDGSAQRGGGLRVGGGNRDH